MTDHTELEKAARAALDVLNQDRSKMTPADEVAIDFGLNDTIEAFDDLSGPSAVLSLIAEVRELREALTRLATYLTNAKNDAGYMFVNEDETGFSDMREALIAVVFNDDGQEFLGMTAFAASILEKGQSND